MNLSLSFQFSLFSLLFPRMSVKRSRLSPNPAALSSSSSPSPLAVPGPSTSTSTSTSSPSPSSSPHLPSNLITDPSLTLSLQRYLQRRQYSNPHLSSEKSLSLEEFALKEVIANEVSSNDAVQFGCFSAEPGPIDQQYCKFKVRKGNKSTVCQLRYNGKNDSTTPLSLSL